MKCLNEGTSDLHLSVGSYPAVRKNGMISFWDDCPIIKKEELVDLVERLVEEKQMELLSSSNNCFLSYAIPGKGRFRVCIYKQRSTYFVTFRVSNFKAPDKVSLRLPDETDGIFDIKSGLILVTGPKGSGTTSTCSYIINTLRQTRNSHIVTIEDPIEYLYHHDKSIISQMEVGLDVKDRDMGIEIALRDNADIIYLSSLMDTSTIKLAFEAARSGKIVITTMDVLGVEDVIRYIVDIFPSDRSNYIRTLVAQSLKCIISQQLITDVDGEMLPLCEVLYGVKSTANLIRENKIVQIGQIMRTGSRINMLSKDNHLKNLFESGLITEDTMKVFAADWNSLAVSLSKSDEG